MKNELEMKREMDNAERTRMGCTFPESETICDGNRNLKQTHDQIRRSVAFCDSCTWNRFTLEVLKVTISGSMREVIAASYTKIHTHSYIFSFVVIISLLSNFCSLVPVFSTSTNSSRSAPRHSRLFIEDCGTCRLSKF